MIHRMFLTKAQGIMLVSLWVLMVVLYFTLYCISLNPVRSKLVSNRRLVWKSYNHEEIGENSYTGTEDYLIKTPGCYLPNYAKTLKFKEPDDMKVKCGLRAIFVDKYGDDLKFRIDEELMKIHREGRKEEYICCYRFVSRLTIPGREESGVSYSSCMQFRNGTTIKFEQEALDVSCMTVPHKKTKSVVIYKDAYMLVKKVHMDQAYNEDRLKSWNVLVLGLDTMSRARLINSMPDTFSYIKRHGWLDYKGYNKVGSNTYPNMMAFLTGMKITSVWRKCSSTMSDCNDDMMWSKYREAGYVNAYGEDDLRLPDTFCGVDVCTDGFRAQPTMHYMRPLYLTGETRRGNLICTKQVPSATNTLSYALDFVETYKNDNFFGFFWINSYTHDGLKYIPSLLDKEIIDFFEKLNATGALSNTFIFFLSDHGIRFGKFKLQAESYYEERLPMFFMWSPIDFRKSHPSAQRNLEINQNRLITPYDLHETFRSILQLSTGLVTGERSEACPTCTSLFEVKSVYRTCASANIDERWCSCRNLNDVDTLVYAYDVVRNINLAVSYIQNLTKFIETAKCTKCYLLQFNKVLRAQMKVDHVNKVKNYVIAFEMLPGEVAYEVSLQENNRGTQIVKPIFPVTEYSTHSRCVLDPNDRPYCVCKNVTKCS